MVSGLGNGTINNVVIRRKGRSKNTRTRSKRMTDSRFASIPFIGIYLLCGSMRVLWGDGARVWVGVNACVHVLQGVCVEVRSLFSPSTMFVGPSDRRSGY